MNSIENKAKTSQGSSEFAAGASVSKNSSRTEEGRNIPQSTGNLGDDWKGSRLDKAGTSYVKHESDAGASPMIGKHRSMPKGA